MKFVTASSLLSTGVLTYSAGQLLLGGFELNSPRVRAEAHKVRSLIAGIDGGVACISLGVLFHRIETRYRLFSNVEHLISECGDLVAKGAWALMVGVFALGIPLSGAFGQRAVNKRLFAQLEAPPPAPLGSGGKTEWDRPTAHRVSQVCLSIALCSLVAGLTLRPRLTQAVLASAIAFGLVQLSRQRWLNYSANFSADIRDNRGQVEKISISVSILMALVARTEVSASDCAVCHQNDGDSRIFFCPAHDIHQKCVPEVLNSTFHQFFSTVDAIQRVERKRQTGSSEVWYEADIREGNLPHCETCSSLPVALSFSGRVRTKDKGDRPLVLRLVAADRSVFGRVKRAIVNRLSA